MEKAHLQLHYLCQEVWFVHSSGHKINQGGFKKFYKKNLMATYGSLLGFTLHTELCSKIK